MLPEQVEVWLDAINAWNGRCPRRLNAILETIGELAKAGQGPDVQMLAQALLNRPDNGLQEYQRGELHFYVSNMESRDAGFALQQSELAKYYMKRAPPNNEFVQRWLDRIDVAQRGILDRQMQQLAATAGDPTAADGALEAGEAVEEAEAPIETTGQTFTLALRPAA